MTSKQLPALLTVERVAEELGISRSSAYQLIRRDPITDAPPKIRSVTVGRLRRVAATDLEDYVASLPSNPPKRAANA